MSTDVRTTSDTQDQIDAWLRDHHGVISLAEARKLGGTYKWVRARIFRGEWESPYPGVYRSVAAPRSALQELRAVCLGTGGVVSHAAAAWLWGPLSVLSRPIEVCIAREKHRPRFRLDAVVHQVRDLDRSQISTREGLKVTNPLRTLVDLAATSSPELLSEAVETALAKRLVTVAGLEAEMRRLSKHGRPGVGRLRECLAELGYAGAPPSSVLEVRVRRLVARLDIPVPVAEVKTRTDGAYRLDLAWPEILLPVEVDGFAWHSSPKQKRQDELRRQRLREAGWTVLVFDWTQVTKQSRWVGDEISATYCRLVARATR